jgi:hypothetical protein
MSLPIDNQSPVTDEERAPSAAAMNAHEDEENWAMLEQKLAPLDALVPAQPPAWRVATLGVATLAGVAAASIVSLFGVVTLERLLIPGADAADFAHGVALGAFVVAWGLLSLGFLAAAARVALGRPATLGRLDLAAAAIVLVMLGGWTIGLHTWVVGVAGYVELDLIGRGTYVWPAVVVLVTIALAAMRLTRGWVALALLGLAALAIAGLAVETLRNGLGAIADGNVSAPGTVVGVLSIAQLAVLAGWWWVTARGRLAR